ncbi:uncharacterized protein METZ01_LOCUS336171, partial [marine metagenome]
VLIPDSSRSIRQGGLKVWTDGPLDVHPIYLMLELVGEMFGFTLDTPFKDMTPKQIRVILHGSDQWIESPNDISVSVQGGIKKRPKKVVDPNLSFQYRGIFPTVERASRYAHQFSELGRLMQPIPCAACEGGRLRPESRAVTIEGQSIDGFCRLSVEEALRFIKVLDVNSDRMAVAGDVMTEIRNRLRFLLDVGLDYLSLDRRAPTLSGGEAQRIRLASQIGSGLTGVLYVLDEPTIGLHARDNRRLIHALTNLRDLGNTLIMVEHDRETLESADHLVDFGPGAGINGGRVVSTGSPAKVRKSKKSLTGNYLSNRLALEVPGKRRKPGYKKLQI